MYNLQGHLWSARAARVAALFLFAATLIPRTVRPQSDGPGANCAAVLQQGTYNTIKSKSSTSNYLKARQAACSNYSSYDYNAYTEAKKDSTQKSWAFNFVAVDTVYVDVNVNGQASRNIKDYASFDTAKTAVREYARASCKNFSINTKDQADSTVLSVTIDKSVYPAYTSCLELYKDGVRVSQTPGYNGRSLTVDFKYVPPSGSINAEVNFTGINIKPAGAATCSMFGYGKSNLSPNGIAGLQSFVFRMEPNAVYSVYCALTATAPLNNFTTVFLYTSKGSSFQALLYNGQGHDEIKRIARLETRMTELKAKLNIAPDGRTLQPKRVCAGNACVAGRGNSIVFQHKATGFVRAEFDFTKITSVANLDRFKIYTGPTLAANTDSYFFVSKENRMGVWSMSKSRPDMKLVATKYCTDHYDWDCITSFTPVCRNVTTPAKAGAGSTDPRVALPGHRVWCGTDEFLQGWTPKRSYDNVWFEFTCCKLPR